MLRTTIIVISLLCFGEASAQDHEFIGTWNIEVITDSAEQFPWWMEVKYPKKLRVFLKDEELSFHLTDQFDFECEGSPLVVNRDSEIVFAFCGGGGTKSPSSWSPLHHAKVVEGNLQGVVTSDRYLFKWVGTREH